MAEIVKIDRSGRVVIPRELRRELGIKDDDQLLVSSHGKDRLLLQRLDVEALARGLSEEMAGKDVDAIVSKVRKETDAKAKRLYPEIFT